MLAFFIRIDFIHTNFYDLLLCMNSNDVIIRSLGLIDLPNTQFITYNDKLNSVNESFKDIYNLMLQSNDDYFLTEVSIVVTSAMAGTGPYEYQVPLPTNFFQLRYIDYHSQQGWVPMKKWNMGTKDDLLTEPEYRIANNNLWIITGTPTASVPFTIKVGYYPPPFAITLQDSPISYGLSYTVANFSLINPATVFFFHYNGITPYDVMFYAYNGKTINIEVNQTTPPQTATVPFTLYADSANITGINYYKGYLYWSNANGVLRSAAVDITNPAVITSPINISGPSPTILNFTINGNNIYESTSTATNTIAITAPGSYGTPNAILSFPTLTTQVFPNGNLYYLGNGDTLVANTAIPTVLMNGILDIANDGTNLYALDTSKNLWLLPIVSFGVLGIGTIITTDVSTQIGLWENGRLPILTQEGQTLSAFSAYVSYDFSLMNNIVPEIMAYRAAIDFGIKQGRDVTQQQLNELWVRFRNMIKRDEYKYERVQNYYRNFTSSVFI